MGQSLEHQDQGVLAARRHGGRVRRPVVCARAMLHGLLGAALVGTAHGNQCRGEVPAHRGIMAERVCRRLRAGVGYAPSPNPGGKVAACCRLAQADLNPTSRRTQRAVIVVFGEVGIENITILNAARDRDGDTRTFPRPTGHTHDGGRQRRGTAAAVATAHPADINAGRRIRTKAIAAETSRTAADARTVKRCATAAHPCAVQRSSTAAGARTVDIVRTAVATATIVLSAKRCGARGLAGRHTNSTIRRTTLAVLIKAARSVAANRHGRDRALEDVDPVHLRDRHRDIWTKMRIAV